MYTFIFAKTLFFQSLVISTVTAILIGYARWLRNYTVLLLYIVHVVIFMLYALGNIL